MDTYEIIVEELMHFDSNQRCAIHSNCIRILGIPNPRMFAWGELATMIEEVMRKLCEVGE